MLLSFPFIVVLVVLLNAIRQGKEIKSTKFKKEEITLFPDHINCEVEKSKGI